MICQKGISISRSPSGAPPLHAGPLPRGPLPCAGLLHLGVPTAPAENGRGGGGLSPPLPFSAGEEASLLIGLCSFNLVFNHLTVLPM